MKDPPADPDHAVLEPFTKGRKVIVRAPHPQRSHPRAATILEPPRVPSWANPALVRYHDGEHPGEEEVPSTALTLAEANVDDEVALLRDVAEKAQDAFWAEVAKSYPKIKTGEWPPDASHAFSTACEKAIADFMLWNKPEQE